MISKRNIEESVFRIREEIGLLDAPISIQWVCTHSCNLSCQHCMVNAGKALDQELSLAEIKKIIDEISQMGVKNFFVTGGEPLLRKDIFKILKYAKDKKLKIGLSTNSSFVFQYKNEFQSLHLGAVMVSLDGLEDNHKKIRGENNNFKETLDALKFFKDINIPKVSVCTTVNRMNLKDLPGLRDIIFSMGADYWYLNITLPEGRAKGKDWLYLNRDEKIDLLSFIKENKKKYSISICSEAGYLGDWNKDINGRNSFFCRCGWSSCAIMANGDIVACPIFEPNDYVAGNIREKSFKEIWENGFGKFKNIKMQESCLACQYNKKCGGGCKVMRILGAKCFQEEL